MGVSVMILGVSGTGKSASMRNFGPDDIALVNVAGKPLPFRGKFNEKLNTDSYGRVIKFIEQTDKKSIVIDDAQYLMANEFMRRSLEKGYDKFTEIGKNFYDLLEAVRLLPDEKIVYLLGHVERDQDGNEKFKTMGKLIDEKINVEGMCTIVLKTCVSDGRYTFLTQNSGHDTVKSPMGMFPSIAIDNDLKYVDEKIRNYYDFEDSVTDEEMEEKDEAVKTDVDPGPKKGRKAARREKVKEEFMAIPDDDVDEMPFDEEVDGVNIDDDEDVDGVNIDDESTDQSTEPVKEPLRRTTYFYIPATDNYVKKSAGDFAPDDSQKITKKDFEEGCNRLSQETKPSENNGTKRRTRKSRKED